MSGICTGPFVVPTRKVKSQEDVNTWIKSKAYAELLGFITTLNKAIKGKSANCTYSVSANIVAVGELFQKVDALMDDIPLKEGDQRFGNKAFSVLGAQIVEKSQEWIEDFLTDDTKPAVVELKAYFDESFGSFIRIDYGTGHEINFIAFCCCLYKIGHLDESDWLATVFYLFVRYLDLMRKIQLWYKLEPAGSQGVWGLDDYQFLPFIFGSSQLIANPEITPQDFVNPNVVAKHHENFIFLGCIKFINDVKTGPFAEHSNQLWNISAVQTWSKVNSGLIKMYKAEVLAKQPVIQHFVFGSILSFEEQKVVLPSSTFSLHPLKTV